VRCLGAGMGLSRCIAPAGPEGTMVPGPGSMPAPLGSPEDTPSTPSSPSSPTTMSSLWKRRSLLPGMASLAIAVQKAKQPCVHSDILKDHFDVLHMLGQGALSTVHHAVRKTDGKHFAVKVVASDDEEIIQVVAEEYEMLRGFDHPNIVRAHDLLMGPTKALLVLDLVMGSDLARAVAESPELRFSEETTRPLARMLLSAVHYLHQHRVVHRDIKPQNLLVNSERSLLKLADFNVARCLKESGSLTPTGTQLYAAPEVLLNEAAPNERSDVWCSGMCIYFMLSGKLPQSRDRCLHSTSSMRAAAERPVLFNEELWETITQPCIWLLQQALTLEWTCRMAPMVLLQCMWFQQADNSEKALKVQRSGHFQRRTCSMPHMEEDDEDDDDDDKRTSVCSDLGHTLLSDEDLLDACHGIWSRAVSADSTSELGRV